MSGKLSREEIARQFQLPERKSKIATLLKQDEQKKYCICQSTDSSRFMIGCDACEEWYHGDCIGISEKDSKHIKQYFCDRCRKQDASLHTRYSSKSHKTKEKSSSQRDRSFKDQKSAPQCIASSTMYRYEEDPDFAYVEDKKKARRKSWSEKVEKPEKRSYHRKKVKRCGQCSHCDRDDDCGRCVACSDMRKFGGPGVTKNVCLMRQCKRYPVKIKQASQRRHKRESSSDEDVDLISDQCIGPECTNPAREGSKYCSDPCGLKMATNRIYQVLPPRLNEWALTPCQAELNNSAQLEKVRASQTQVREVLRELDKRHMELDSILEVSKRAVVDTSVNQDEEEGDEEGSIYCITCGHEVHTRAAIKHMEKCFNKYESQASFGSIYKTRIDGNNMFCDFFNPANRTYCKRLRVICPEHSKEPKVNEFEVCGCPLVTNVFSLTGEFCRASKKHCVKHYCWEKLRRAEIDMERVRQWLKLDELLEQERQIRLRMTTRAGVLALMLHSTYNHELAEKAKSAEKQAADDHAYT